MQHNNRHTIIDYSFITCLKRILIPGYEEARKYMKDYLDARGESVEPPMNPMWITDVLSWAESVGLRQTAFCAEIAEFIEAAEKFFNT